MRQLWSSWRTHRSATLTRHEVSAPSVAQEGKIDDFLFAPNRINWVSDDPERLFLNAFRQYL